MTMAIMESPGAANFHPVARQRSRGRGFFFSVGITASVTDRNPGNHPSTPHPVPLPLGGEGTLLRRPSRFHLAIQRKESPSPPPTNVGLRRRAGEGWGEGS